MKHHRSATPIEHVGLVNSPKEALLQQLLGFFEVAIELFLGLVPGSFKGGQLSGRGREFLISLLDHPLQPSVLSCHPGHLDPRLPQEAFGLSSLLPSLLPLGHLRIQPLGEIGVGSQRLLQSVGRLGQLMVQPRYLLGMALPLLNAQLDQHDWAAQHLKAASQLLRGRDASDHLPSVLGKSCANPLRKLQVTPQGWHRWLAGNPSPLWLAEHQCSYAPCVRPPVSCRHRGRQHQQVILAPWSLQKNHKC